MARINEPQSCPDIPSVTTEAEQAPRRISPLCFLASPQLLQKFRSYRHNRKHNGLIRRGACSASVVTEGMSGQDCGSLIRAMLNCAQSALCRHWDCPHAIQRTTLVKPIDLNGVSAVHDSARPENRVTETQRTVLTIRSFRKEERMVQCELIGEPAHEDDLHYWSGSKDL